MIRYGIQPDKSAGLPPSKFNTGYVNVFAARLRRLSPNIRVVNYGCPGESTKTFIAGGCPWLARGERLHNDFRGAQLKAALRFLRTHRSEVSPITINLWGNEVDALSDACGGRLSCARARMMTGYSSPRARAPRAIAQFASRLTTILRRLRETAPTAEIIAVGAWNNAVNRLRETDPLLRSLNTTIGRVAAGARARFADTFPRFNPQGNIARERARICAFTFTCSRGDGHPTDAGYRAIAAALWAASGYERLR